MKTCFNCKVDKELSDFYQHPRMSDGHLGKCKECTKKDIKINRDKNAEYYSEYDRSRAMLPHRVEARKKYQKTPAGKEAMNRARKKWLGNNSDKRAAHTILGNAVRDGKIDKPELCSICGEKDRIHGHHEDYSKPLYVIWCCPKCHTALHKGAF